MATACPNVTFPPWLRCIFRRLGRLPERTTVYTGRGDYEGYQDMLDGRNIRGIIRCTDADR
jgi:hypothetical protein